MKIAGSYASLLRGVSQQPPEVRVAGQHTEQVNMLPDPVEGLTRRRGTIMQHASFVPVASTPEAVEATGSGYRKIEHTAGGVDYVILLRDNPQGGAAVGESMPPVMCYNKSTKAFIGVSWSIAGADWQSLTRSAGVGAAVSIGQYVIWALRGNALSHTKTQRWGQIGYKKAVVWIRGGTYSRTFTINSNGTLYSFTTPASSVVGSEAQVQPAYIAGQLATALSGGGVTGVQQVGSHLCFDLPVSGDVSVSDGGDGGLMRGVGLVVDSVDKLSLLGVHGHIVKVQPSADSWFYVQATGKATTTGTLQEVVWRECSGEEQGTNLTGLGMMRVVANTLYVGVTHTADPSGLGHCPSGGNPVLVPSIAGDSALNKPHRWMGNVINYLGVFQDRLLIGSGAALSVSAAGDYLNFFRTTMTTVPVSDGFEVVPQGGEDDVLRHSVTYNKNLVVFGDKRQYMIPATVPFTPTAPNMAIMTVYPQAAECQPVAVGGQIYYVRNREGWTDVHQIQPGQFVDSAESFPANAQAGSYIPAPVAEIEHVPGTPSILVLRSRASPRTVYVFSYVDLPDGRKQDAWYRLEFNERCGYLMAMHSTPEGMLMFWARKDSMGLVWRVADLLPWNTKANNKPFLDSMRTRVSMGAIFPGNNGVWPGASDGVWVEALDNSTDKFLHGENLDSAALAALEAMPESNSGAAAWVGLPFDAYVTPTNPFHKDSDGRAITSGRTTITKLVVNTRDSAGMDWTIEAGGQSKVGSFASRVIGLFDVGIVPLLSRLVSVPIGRETRAYAVTLKARYWYPLKIVGIEWVGQSFNRTPRAGG